MTDFNQAIVLGNLTRDPELRYTANGQAVASFSIATNRRWTNRETNEKQESVEFHNIVAWGKLAEICNQILYKGRKALIVGRLQTRSWEGQDGVKRYSTEIVADHISATGVPRGAGEKAIETPPIPHGPDTSPKTKNISAVKPANDKAEPPKPKDSKNEDINIDDIPF